MMGEVCGVRLIFLYILSLIRQASAPDYQTLQHYRPRHPGATNLDLSLKMAMMERTVVRRGASIGSGAVSIRSGATAEVFGRIAAWRRVTWP